MSEAYRLASLNRSSPEVDAVGFLQGAENKPSPVGRKGGGFHIIGAAHACHQPNGVRSPQLLEPGLDFGNGVGRRSLLSVGRADPAQQGRNQQQKSCRYASSAVPPAAMGQNEPSTGEEDGHGRYHHQSAKDAERQGRQRIGLWEVLGDVLDGVEHGVLLRVDRSAGESRT